MSRILLVEDNERLAHHIGSAIQSVALQADICHTNQSAYHALAQQSYDLLILDRGLPDGDGISLLRRLRAEGKTLPCIVLTAQSTIHDRVQGLDVGADDYLSKPFSMEELIARLRALLRRPAKTVSLSPEWGDLKLFTDSGTLAGTSGVVSLASAEIQILSLLIRRSDRTVRRSELEHAAWGVSEAVTPNALDVALHRIRKKLLSIGSRVSIVNIRGRGYQLLEAPL